MLLQTNNQERIFKKEREQKKLSKFAWHSQYY